MLPLKPSAETNYFFDTGDLVVTFEAPVEADGAIFVAEEDILEEITVLETGDFEPLDFVPETQTRLV